MFGFYYLQYQFIVPRALFQYKEAIKSKPEQNIIDNQKIHFKHKVLRTISYN